MKVLMLPHISQLGNEESGIKRVIENYFKFLPDFDIELVPPTSKNYDIKAAHAGMTGADCDVSHLHGIYFTADFPLSTSWEYKANKKIDNFDIKSFGRPGFFLPKEQLEKKPELKEKFKPLSKEDRGLAQQALNFASKQIGAKKYDFLILDEINVALNFRLLDIKTVIDLVEEYRDNIDIVLTGRYCPKEILKIADLISEVKEVKHYFKKGVRAKRAREF